jgi:type I restriction enzyme S subunit
VLEDGDILFARSGNTVGKSFRYHKEFGECIFAGYLIRFRPNRRIAHPDFIFYFTQSSQYQRWIEAKKRVAGQPNVNGTEYASLSLPLPPLLEQRRIVEILDQADALRKKRAEADTKAARILPALFYKMFGDPAMNPKGWPVVRIRDLVTPIERRDPAGQPDNTFVYIDIAGVDGQTGTIVETKELFGAEAPSRARQIVRVNDVIISTVRPYLRATALVPEHLDNQICSTGFCVLRAREGSGFGFLYALSRLQWFTDRLNSRARGASYPAVTDADILGLPVPLPDSPKVHKAFDVQVLDVLAMQQRREHTAKTHQDLFTSLLHSAFTGDLTAKWRESHMKELLAEMEAQAKLLDLKVEL